MERKKFLKLSMLLVVMVMMVFVKPEKVLATSNAIFDSSIKGSLTITKKKEDTNPDTLADDKDPIDGVEYSLYKIANIKQKNVDGEVQLYYEIDTEVIKEGTSIPSAGDIKDMAEMNLKAEKIYDALVAGVSPTAKDTTKNGGVVEFTNLSLGVYLVYESGRPANATQGQSFIVTIPMTNSNGTAWEYDIKATPKNTIGDKPTISKNIVTGTGSDTTDVKDDILSKSASYEIGDTITYRIKAEVPAGVGDLAYYYVEDKPAAGITVDLNTDNGNVTVYGIKKEDGSYVTLTKGKDYDVIDARIYFATSNIASYTDLYIDIKATLNTDAKIGTSSDNTNTAEIRYSATTSKGSTTPDNPTSTDGLDSVKDLTGEAPKVYTFGIDLTKKLEGSDTDISGVKFELLDEDKKEVNVKSISGVYCLDSTSSTNEVVTDNSGEIKIKGLSAGTYYLKETVTKSGYTLLKEPIAIVITGTSNENSNTMTVETKINGTTATEDIDGYFTFTVLNKKGFTLPETGGRGIYIFTITGLLIMAGAVVLMVKNKKKSK